MTQWSQSRKTLIFDIFDILAICVLLVLLNMMEYIHILSKQF